MNHFQLFLYKNVSERLTTISPYEAACLYTLANQTQLLGGGGGGGGGTFCGGGTESSSRTCLSGQNPLADCVRPASGLCPGGHFLGGTKSAMHGTGQILHIVSGKLH